jgi:phospholipid/cholesterol/gamma-HCH transport system permease protein
MAAPSLPAPVEATRDVLSPVLQPFRILSQVASVSGKALLNVPAALKYRAVIGNHISDIAVGAGAFLVGAGAVIVIVIMTAVIGIQTSLEGTKGLELIGAEDLVGFVSAYASIREIAPLMAGVIFASQIGAHFTAELGAMRISDEIDALEVMGMPSMRYLVSTRLVASLVVVMPLYAHRHPHHVDGVLLGGTGRLRPVLQPVPAAPRPALQRGQGAGVHLARHVHPLRVRIPRQRRP